MGACGRSGACGGRVVFQEGARFGEETDQMFDELFPKEVDDIPSGVVNHGSTAAEGDSEELVEGARPDDVVPCLDRGWASRDFVARTNGWVRLDEAFVVFSSVAVSCSELGEAAGDGMGELLEPVMWSESWFQVGGHMV